MNPFMSFMMDLLDGPALEPTIRRKGSAPRQGRKRFASSTLPRASLPSGPPLSRRSSTGRKVSFQNYVQIAEIEDPCLTDDEKQVCWWTAHELKAMKTAVLNELADQRNGISVSNQRLQRKISQKRPVLLMPSAGLIEYGDFLDLS